MKIFILIIILFIAKWQIIQATVLVDFEVSYTGIFISFLFLSLISLSQWMHYKWKSNNPCCYKMVHISYNFIWNKHRWSMQWLYWQWHTCRYFALTTSLWSEKILYCLMSNETYYNIKYMYIISSSVLYERMWNYWPLFSC